jgi:hypothetical protein
MYYHERLLTEFIASSFSTGEINIIPDDKDLLQSMGEVFPFHLGVVQWKRFRVHRSRDRFSSNQEISDEIISYVSDFSAGSPVSYVGDNLIEFSLIFEMRHLPKMLACLLDIPQHHYFFSLEDRWLMRLSFEDDLDFGIL